MAEAINTFNDGLIMDIHPLLTPNKVLTNALNATLITFNGNEFMLLNDMGNGKIETAFLPTGYVPVGVKEFGGIIYVASYNPITNRSQIGSFPSPERIVSSDECEYQPDAVFKTSDFEPKLKTADYPYDYNGLRATKEYILTKIFPSDKIFNPGDKFIISFNSELLLEAIQKILSLYGLYTFIYDYEKGYRPKRGKDQDPSKLKELYDYIFDLRQIDPLSVDKEKSGYINLIKDVTIHLATLSNSGNINYIEENLIRDKNNGYWMLYSNYIGGKNKINPDDYRASIGDPTKYNIYSEKFSALLVLVVELEGIKDFELQRKITPESPGQSDTNFKVEFYGESNKYTVYDSNSDKNGAELKGYLVRYQSWKKGEVPPDQDTWLKEYVYLNSDSYLDDNTRIVIKSSSGFDFTTDSFLNYEIIPFTNFLYVERFKKTGLIDFSKVNTGSHTLTEWRYYSDNDLLILNYGFDYYPLELTLSTKCYIEFLDCTHLTSIIYDCKDRLSLSGNFMELITYDDYLLNNIKTPPDDRIELPKSIKEYNKPVLFKDNFYICRINISEFTSDDDYLIWRNLKRLNVTFSGTQPSYTQIRDTFTNKNREVKLNSKNFYRYLYTTGLFNETYVSNNYDDFGKINLADVTSDDCLHIVATSSKESESILLSREKRVEDGDFYILGSTSQSSMKYLLIDTYDVSSVIIPSSELYKENFYFGKYNKEWINFQIDRQVDPVTSVSNKNRTANMSGQLDLLYIDQLTNIDDQSNISNINLTTLGLYTRLNLQLKVSRGIVGDMMIDYITYKSKELKQYSNLALLNEYKSRSKIMSPLKMEGYITKQWLNLPDILCYIDGSDIEVQWDPKPSEGVNQYGSIVTIQPTNLIPIISESEDKAVIDAAKVGDDYYPRIISAENGLHFGGTCLGASREWSGLIEMFANGDRVESIESYISGHIISNTQLKETIETVVERDALPLPTTMILHGGPDVNNLRVANDDNASQAITEWYKYSNGKGEFASNRNYMFMLWKTFNKNTEYVVTNQGAASANNYDSETGGEEGTYMSLAEGMNNILSKLYLAQFENKSNNVYKFGNYIYDNDYNTIFNITYNIATDNKINHGFFSYNVEGVTNAIWFDRYNGSPGDLTNPDTTFRFIPFFNTNILEDQRHTFSLMADLDPSFNYTLNLPPILTDDIILYTEKDSNQNNIIKLLLLYNVGISSSVYDKIGSIKTGNLQIISDLEGRTNYRSYSRDVFGNRLNHEKIYTINPIIKYVYNNSPQYVIILKTEGITYDSTNNEYIADIGTTLNEDTGVYFTRQRFKSSKLSKDPTILSSGLYPIDDFGDITYGNNNYTWNEKGMIFLDTYLLKSGKFDIRTTRKIYDGGVRSFASVFGKTDPSILLPSILLKEDSTFDVDFYNEPLFNRVLSTADTAEWVGYGIGHSKYSAYSIYKDLYFTDVFKMRRASSEHSSKHLNYGI